MTHQQMAMLAAVIAFCFGEYLWLRHQARSFDRRYGDKAVKRLPAGE